MKRCNVFIKSLIVILSIVVLAVIVCIRIIFNWTDNTEVKMIGKTHVDFVVLPGQVIDYTDFIVLNDETKPLKQIDEEIRYKISDYMKNNNLKLKEGHHYFNRVNGTYDEYINDNFKFEKIK